MTTSGSTTAQELVELLVQLGRAAYADCAADGLTPAQWTALRFFSRANRFSRTVSAFAEFHATTRGTASQTVKSLVDRDLLARRRSERDGRSVIFQLTGSGRSMLRRDPLLALVRAAEKLEPASSRRVGDELARVRDWLAEERSAAATGKCARCGHLRRQGDNLRCGLMEEPLEASELDEYCLRFRPAAGG